MKNIKNLFYSVSSIALVSVPMTVSAQWAGWEQLQSDSGLPEGDNFGGAGDGASGILLQIMKWLLGIVGFLAVIAFVIAGILYLMSGGDDTRTERAKKMFFYAIIGVIVSLIGLVIVVFIDSALRGYPIF